ncbi:MAG TPA: gliding motility-associated C-terminal domain-containing protein, partial [Bacteroidia bacterium]
LQASAGSGTITWYDQTLTQIGTGASFTPTGITTSTILHVAVVDANNCSSASVPVSITFNNLPAVDAGVPVNICNGLQTTLTATGASSFVWDNGVTNGVPFTPASLMYHVTGTDATTGCTNTDSVAVNVYPALIIGTTTGNTADVCAASSITLSGTSTTSGVTYVWDNGVTDGVSFTPTANGTYNVVGTDANGCTGTASVVVYVHSLPSVNTGVTASIPCGVANFVVSGVTTNASNPSYSWAGPLVIADGTTATPTIGGIGQYTLTVTDGTTLCTSTATLDVTGDIVVAAFTPSVTQGFAPLPVNFANQSTSSSPLTYSWNFGDGSAGSTATNPSNTYNTMGSYWVVLTASANGCSDKDSVLIIIDQNSSIVIPNIFSPNGDGLNDELTIVSQGIKEMTIDIFNRWGQKVYVIDRPGQNWDGLLANGEAAAEGTYFYLLKAVGFDTKEYTAQGPVMLVK